MSDLICQVELNAVKTCTEPASMTATFGCIHEHITTKPMCLNHLLALGGERVLCLKCWNASADMLSTSLL
jgi:hypothetical protein